MWRPEVTPSPCRPDVSRGGFISVLKDEAFSSYFCNPESFAGHGFKVSGTEVEVKTLRDVSAFLPKTLVEKDSDDEIVVMAWHRDNEDSLVPLGWGRVETLVSKVE